VKRLPYEIWELTIYFYAIKYMFVEALEEWLFELYFDLMWEVSHVCKVPVIGGGGSSSSSSNCLNILIVNQMVYIYVCVYSW
jgi:hypothetical protein